MSEDDLRPARGTRGREEPAPVEAPREPEPVVEHDEAAALERGRTAAMVAALGRVQMSLDILTRKVAALEETVRGQGAAQARAASQSSAAPAAQASTSVSGGGPASA
jgi:hypothetical protein